MAYKLKQSGDYRKRRNFSMIKNSLAISDLLEVQTESYKWFATEGIKEVFETFSPIESFSGSLSLEFGEYEFGTPRYSIKECKDRQITYAAPLKVQTRLFNNETGEVKEQEIFLGDMPLMTDAGTFIIMVLRELLYHNLLDLLVYIILRKLIKMVNLFLHLKLFHLEVLGLNMKLMLKMLSILE